MDPFPHTAASELMLAPESTGQHPVFHLPELLEMIFLESSAIELLTSIRSVCHLWKNIIVSSPTIERYLRNGYDQSSETKGNRDPFTVTPLAHQVLNLYWRKASKILAENGDRSIVASKTELGDDDQAVQNDTGEGFSGNEHPVGSVQGPNDRTVLANFYWKSLCALRRLYLHFQSACQNIALFSGIEESIITALYSEKVGKGPKLWIKKESLDQVFPTDTLMQSWAKSLEEVHNYSRYGIFCGFFRRMVLVEGEGDVSTRWKTEYRPQTGDQKKLEDVRSPLEDIFTDLAYWAYYKLQNCVPLNLNPSAQIEENRVMIIWMLNSFHDCPAIPILEESWCQGARTAIEKFLESRVEGADAEREIAP